MQTLHIVLDITKHNLTYSVYWGCVTHNEKVRGRLPLDRRVMPRQPLGENGESIEARNITREAYFYGDLHPLQNGN